MIRIIGGSTARRRYAGIAVVTRRYARTDRYAASTRGLGDERSRIVGAAVTL
jgi:hypothetical protein